MKATEILFVAFGSLGDVYPLLAIAKKMQVRHDVTFLANEYFRNHVEAAKLKYFPIGLVEDQLAGRETLNSSGETEQGRKGRFENIIGKSFKITYEFIAKKVANDTRLLVITNGNLSPAVLACEAFNIPMIITHYAPSQIPNNYEDSILCASFYGKYEWWIRYVSIPFAFAVKKLKFELKDQFNEHRKKLGLTPITNSFKSMWKRLVFSRSRSFRPQLNIPIEIVFAPKWFCEPIDRKLVNLQFTGFPFYDEENYGQELKIEKFIELNGKPLVFTPGTAVEDVEAFAREIIPICRKLASPAIFCSKHGKTIFEKLDSADDVSMLFVEHANLLHLLPKSRCLIHHGGIGTTAQAIRAGIPQIVRPRMYDQPANGVRIMMFGLGGSIFPNAYRADNVANILTHIESSSKHKEMIAYYSDLVRNDDGVANCVTRIEKFLTEGSAENVESAENSPAY